MRLTSTAAMSALACAAGLYASPALAQSQGVSKTEITLGSIQDLSGPLAGFGKQIRNGMASDNVATGKLPGLQALGVQPASLEAIGPSYLGAQGLRSGLLAKRKTAGRF